MSTSVLGVTAGPLGLLCLLFLMLPAGIWFLVSGLLGKRLNDHPTCRKCRYDLVGTPDANDCPECGRDLSLRRAIKIGQRQKSRGKIVAGLLMLSLVFGAVGFGIYRDITANGATRYKPDWFLHYEAMQTGTASSKSALVELYKRMKTNRLSTRRVTRLTDDAMKLQADMATTWEPLWGVLFEEAHEQGHVDEADWHRYLTRAINTALSLQVRPKVRRGQPIYIRVKRHGGRAGHGADRHSLYLRCTDGTVSIEDVLNEPFGANSGNTMGSGAGGSSGRSFALTQDQWQALGDKINTVSLNLKVFIQRRSRQKEPIFTHEAMLSAQFQVVDGPTTRAVVDPAQRKAMQSAITLNTIEVGPLDTKRDYRRVAFKMLIGARPYAIAAEIIMTDPTGKTIQGITLKLPPSTATTPSSSEHGCRLKGVDAKTYDIILRPSAKAAESSVDITQYWGEDIVFKNVKVTYKK